MLKNLFIVILFGFLFASSAIGQDSTKRRVFRVFLGNKVKGDTIPVIVLEEVKVYPEPKFKNIFHYWRYRRLVINVKKVYPYAKLSKRKFDEMNAHYLELKTERERKKYVNQLERELLEEFEDDLRSMTISQGRLLIKLIDRETGNTSYEILQEYKGNLSAFFWQALARLFGSNLKSEYEAEGEDKIVEEIIQLYEAGRL
ncbi:DUF4294 domain-containing protein [Bacteroidota bacterium]